MIRFIFYLFLLFNNVYGANNSVVWPLYPFKAIKTVAGVWSDNFFIIKSNKTIYKSDGSNIEKIKSFAFKVNLVYHIPLMDADVIAGFSNKKNILQYFVIDKEGNIITDEKIQMEHRVLDFDLRFTLGRVPVILMLIEESPGFGIALWYNERYSLISHTSEPAQKLSLQWFEKKGHYISKKDDGLYWSIWSLGNYFHYKIPLALKNLDFIIEDGVTYLVGVDSAGAIWSLNIEKDKIVPIKIFSSSLFQYANEFKVFFNVDHYVISLILPEEKKIIYAHLGKSIRKAVNASIQSFFLLTNSYSEPGLIKEKLVWLENVSDSFIYLRRSDSGFSPINNFSWTIKNTSGFPQIFMEWNNPVASNTLYRYIINDAIISNPLPDYQKTGERINYNPVKEGTYILHIQAKNSATNEESPVYHFPMKWQKPEMPLIELINEKSPGLITDNFIQIMIKNRVSADYYVSANKIPVDEPRSLASFNNGIISVPVNFKPGKYYLHVRVRDKNTGEFSSTNHYIFFRDEFEMEQSVGLTEFNADTQELNYLLEKFSKSETGKEREYYYKKIYDLRKRIEKEIKDQL